MLYVLRTDFYPSIVLTEYVSSGTLQVFPLRNTIALGVMDLRKNLRKQEVGSINFPTQSS